MQGEKMEDRDLLLLAENVEMRELQDTKDTYTTALKVNYGYT